MKIYPLLKSRIILLGLFAVILAISLTITSVLATNDKKISNTHSNAAAYQMKQSFFPSEIKAPASLQPQTAPKNFTPAVLGTSTQTPPTSPTPSPNPSLTNNSNPALVTTSQNNQGSSAISISASPALPSSSPASSSSPTPALVPSPSPSVCPVGSIDCAQPAANCHYQGGNSCSCGQLVCIFASPTPTPLPSPSVCVLQSIDCAQPGPGCHYERIPNECSCGQLVCQNPLFN